MMLIDFFDVCANYRNRLTKKCSRTLAVRMNSGIPFASRRSIIKTRQVRSLRPFSMPLRARAVGFPVRMFQTC